MPGEALKFGRALGSGWRRLPGMTIEARTFRVAEIEPADPAGVDASYEIRRATLAHDVPDFPPLCRYRHDAALRTPLPGVVASTWLVHDGDRPVGVGEVRLPQLDNLDNALCEIYVHPDHRRRGAGRALYEHLVAHVRAAGRTRLMADTFEALPGRPARDGAGTAFARAVGLADALREVRRRLDLSTVDADGYDRILADAWRHAEGYSLVQWRDRTPAEYRSDVAYLDGRLISDAPMGDLAWAPENIDADRICAIEEALAGRGLRGYNTAIRHDGTGRIVAWTALAIESSVPDHAWQQITIVDPPHLGHRLGTIAKIANLRYATAGEPALRVIDTWNAAVNDHMISINEALGFRPVDVLVKWQQQVPRG
jgi:GNAT superfamily N-acetyltransferase